MSGLKPDDHASRTLGFDEAAMNAWTSIMSSPLRGLMNASSSLLNASTRS